MPAYIFHPDGDGFESTAGIRKLASLCLWENGSNFFYVQLIGREVF